METDRDDTVAGESGDRVNGRDVSDNQVKDASSPNTAENSATATEGGNLAIELPDYPAPICDNEEAEPYLSDICLEIANNRQRPLFVLLSDKISVGTFLAVTHWRKALSTVGEHSGFDILLQSPGGELSACYQMARMFARFAKCWHALVPFYASSGATLISLGSASITMSDFAQLGPLDPQVISKRPSKFFYGERQSPYGGFSSSQISETVGARNNGRHDDLPHHSARRRSSDSNTDGESTCS